MIKTFPTIDLCVAYLESVGCEWSYEKEQELRKNKLYEYNGMIVMYDKYGILD